MVQVEIVSFWICDFFQEVQSSILLVAISFLIVKTPLLCFTDVKLSSVHHHSVHTLISVIQRWSEHVEESKDLVYNIQHKDRCLSSSNTSFLHWGFVCFRIERICHHKFPRGTQKKKFLHGVVLLDYNLQAVQWSKSLSSITASCPSHKQIQLIAMNETQGQSRHKCTDCVQ